MKQHEPKETVFVNNPELTDEFKILKASGIYNISNDPETPTHLTLKKFQTYPVCGMPYILTGFTLGLVPATTPSDSNFSFTIQAGNEPPEERSFYLEAVEKISPVQYLFKPFKNDERTFGRILREDFYNTKGGTIVVERKTRFSELFKQESNQSTHSITGSAGSE